MTQDIETDTLAKMIPEEKDESLTSILIDQLSILLSSVVSFLAGNTGIWLVPFLIMAWTYRWVAIHYLRALIYHRGVYPVIMEDNLVDQEGKLNVAKAVRTIELVLNRPNITTIVLLVGNSRGGVDDICSWHELAVYLNSIANSKGIRVVSFLRGRVKTAGYILALAANTIMVDYTTRLEMNVSMGVDSILREGSRTVSLGHLDMAGSEVVDAGLADEVGNYIDFLINKVGAVIVPVEGPEGWEITGFGTHGSYG